MIKHEILFPQYTAPDTGTSYTQGRPEDIVSEGQLCPQNISLFFCHHIPFWHFQSSLNCICYSTAVQRSVDHISFVSYHGTQSTMSMKRPSQLSGIHIYWIRAQTRIMPYLDEAYTPVRRKQFLAEDPRVHDLYIHQYPSC